MLRKEDLRHSSSSECATLKILRRYPYLASFVRIPYLRSKIIWIIILNIIIKFEIIIIIIIIIIIAYISLLVITFVGTKVLD